MKTSPFLLSILVSGLLFLSLGADEFQKEAFSEQEIHSLSRAFGHFVVESAKKEGLNMKSVIKGIDDGRQGKESPMSQEEYRREAKRFQGESFRAQSEKNLEAAEDFLEKNASEKGIEILVEGKLHYRILKQGKGDSLDETKVPLLHYTGRYIDGKVFSSSHEWGEPILLPLDQSIAGFGKGLVGMKAGEKRELFIHPDLAYGESGDLLPNSLLIFEIDLIEIQDK